MRTELLKVLGMTCEGCVTTITRALKATDGVGDAKVSLAAGEVTVQYDERLASPAQLQLAVTGAGYGVNERAAAPHHAHRGGCCG